MQGPGSGESKAMLGLVTVRTQTQRKLLLGGIRLGPEVCRLECFVMIPAVPPLATSLAQQKGRLGAPYGCIRTINIIFSTIMLIAGLLGVC